jgi:hypothetical protein
MSTTPEHEFIAKCTDEVLSRFSNIRLMGVRESERRMFDYSCVLMRDSSRPLVAQVLWRHQEGIDKDLRTLLQDAESLVKVYFVKDTIRARSRIDEVLTSYRRNPATRDLLRGLRIIPVPSGFDADKENDRAWMAKHIEESVTSDVLFNIVFGRFVGQDFRIFSEHGGPFGLKFAVLEIIIREAFWHMPTLKSQIQYGTTGPIREVMTMLNAGGFTRDTSSGIKLSTAKGRLIIDLVRRLLFETRTQKSWASETLLLLGLLDIHPQDLDYYHAIDKTKLLSDRLARLFYSAQMSEHAFGVDLFRGNRKSNLFYIENYGSALEKAISDAFPSVPPLQLSEPDVLLFIDPVSVQK